MLNLSLGIKKPKGTYGYLDSMHLYSAVKAGFCLAVCLFLVLCARVFFKDHGSVFTICAVISAIPTAMSVVSLVMHLRFKTGDRRVYEETEALRGKIPVLYDCVVTTTGKSYPVDVFLCTNKNLTGYSADPTAAGDELKRHLEYSLKKGGFGAYNIKIFDTYDKYKERLDYIAKRELKVLKSDQELYEYMKELIL